MFFRQRSTDLAHARPKFPRTEPLGDARHKVIKQQSICFRKDLLGVGREPIRRVRFSKTGSTPFTLNQTIAFETDEVRSDGIVCQFQGGGEFINGARFDPKQSEDLTVTGQNRYARFSIRRKSIKVVSTMTADSRPWLTSSTTTMVSSNCA